MSDGSNPYASPEFDGGTQQPLNKIPPDVRKKIEAVIKDAGQLWLAIVICILCSALGSILIAPWYGVRLSQWYSLKNQYPELLDPNAPNGSLQRNFQSARPKLIAGICFGIFMIFAGLAYVILSLVLTG